MSKQWLDPPMRRLQRSIEELLDNNNINKSTVLLGKESVNTHDSLSS